MMGVGLLAIVYGVAVGIPGQRIWANLLVNIFFFLSIGLGATFYLAKKYVSEAAYAIVYKRVYEAISGYVTVGAGSLLLFLLMGFLHFHHIYHWMDSDVYNPESEHFDKIIAGKAPYFNTIFFWGRMLLFFGLYIFCDKQKKREEKKTLSKNMYCSILIMP